MVLCKYFIDGQECPFLQKCPDEHLDIRQFIKTEMECAVNGNQWPLSCFGPFTEKPCISNYIEDKSFEEVRMMYYDSNNQSFVESCQQFFKAINEAKNKMKTLLTMNKEVMDVLTTLYDESAKETVQAKSNSFDFFANKVFAGSGVFQFGSSGSATPAGSVFGTPKKSVLGQSAFGFGFGVQQPQNVGFFNPPQPTQVGFFGSQSNQQQLQQTNPFGGNAFTQAVNQTPTGRGCDECKEYLKEIFAKMDSILSSVNENSDALKKQIEDIKFLINSAKANEENEKKTTKDMVKEGTSMKNVPPLVIKPKSKQSSGKTKSDIKDNIDPLNLSVQINSLSKNADGSIFIRCKNEESLRKLENEVKANFGDLYDVQILKLAKPRILVVGIDNELDEDNLIQTIKQQNKIKSEMMLIRCIEKANNGYKYNAIIEVEKDLHRMLMAENEPYFNIGWNKCHVFDNLNVRRCFNCWGFNHNARSCRSETKCPKCGGEHTAIDCKNRKLTCTNCTKANKRLNLNLDVRHDARNHNCHIYLKMLQKERDMVDY